MFCSPDDRYNPNGTSSYTEKEIDIIFNQCVEDIHEMYEIYENTDQGISVDTIINNIHKNDFKLDSDTKKMMRYIEPRKSKDMKVYIRLYQPTGNWYIGYTTQESARARHLREMWEVVRQRYNDTIHTASKILRFYDEVIDEECGFNNLEDYDDDNFLIYTVATVRDARTAKIIEGRLIKYFTDQNNHTSLPIDLCLNTQGITDNSIRILHL